MEFFLNFVGVKYLLKSSDIWFVINTVYTMVILIVFAVALFVERLRVDPIVCHTEFGQRATALDYHCWSTKTFICPELNENGSYG